VAAEELSEEVVSSSYTFFGEIDFAIVGPRE
jgi:hypothetical protein